MVDSSKARTLANLSMMVARLQLAADDAQVAKDQMTGDSQLVRQMIYYLDTLPHTDIRNALEVFSTVQSLINRLVESIPEHARIYEKAWGRADRAAQEIALETEESGSDLPQQAISAAVLAKLSWERASQQALHAAGALEEALGIPQFQVVDKVKEAAGMMISSDDGHDEACLSVKRAEDRIRDYAGTI